MISREKSIASIAIYIELSHLWKISFGAWKGSRTRADHGCPIDYPAVAVWLKVWIFLIFLLTLLSLNSSPRWYEAIEHRANWTHFKMAQSTDFHLSQTSSVDQLKSRKASKSILFFSLTLSSISKAYFSIQICLSAILP